MTNTDEYRTIISALPESALVTYLSSNSGLPGPRSNLSLLAAFGDVANAELVLRLVNSPDEYLCCCATAAIGRLVGQASSEEQTALIARLRVLASDSRWRVRESVAMALQRIGDDQPALLREVVLAWSGDDDPLICRAAVAGICEPRLLEGDTALAALAACARATERLTAVPVGAARREPAVRTLRQGLGYCWSVAVAALPDDGVPIFLALSQHPDPDVAWIVRENRKKARLRHLLPDDTRG